jgi:hypothetical protein
VRPCADCIELCQTLFQFSPQSRARENAGLVWFRRLIAVTVLTCVHITIRRATAASGFQPLRYTVPPAHKQVGGGIVHSPRSTVHKVRPARRWTSLTCLLDQGARVSHRSNFRPQTQNMKTRNETACPPSRSRAYLVQPACSPKSSAVHWI